MTLIPVTVVIIVKNEETNLPACLAKAKLGAFTEILVVGLPVAQIARGKLRKLPAPR